MNNTLPPSSQTDQQSTSGEDHQTGPLIVLFVFLALFFSCILREINKKVGIPYTPMLLILGIFFGYFRNNLDFLGNSANLFQQISPQMILLVFIPTLIFQSSLNCDWHVFRKSMLNIILLAGPGVLWSAFILAFSFKIILGYDDQDLTWYQALALGSILSATDPVAVVALLKELGASVKFNTLIEGQSILNDGTAMVFFTVFLNLVKGVDSSPQTVIVNFVRISFGGPLLGLIFGILVAWWMKKIIRDNVLSIMITLIGTYLCFYIAQFTILQVSGILSIFAFGLYFSAVGKRKIFPQSLQILHNFWSAIQYSSESLIFILTGIVVGVNMIGQSTITAMDWIKMIMFWFLMILSRVIMVFTFYPSLVGGHYEVSMKEIVVLIYGGLRGALGVCLSLIVLVDDTLPRRFRQLTIFYMCGMAVLTIVVNGLTCKKLVQMINMIKVPPIKEKLLKNCLTNLQNFTEAKMQELKNDPTTSCARWKQVRQLIQNKKDTRSFQIMQQSMLRIEETGTQEKDRAIRFQFTTYLLKYYWQYYHEGALSQQSIQILSSCCKISNDQVENKLRYFQILKGFFTLDQIQFLVKFKDIPIIGKYCDRWAIHKIYFTYQTSLIFVEACEEILPALHNYFPIYPERVQSVISEVNQNIQKANEYISELETNYPSEIQAAQTKRAATILLRNNKSQLKKMYEEGYVDDKDYVTIAHDIDLLMLRIKEGDYNLEEIKQIDMLRESPLFSCLSHQELANLISNSHDKKYQKGVQIQLLGKRVPATLITSGSVLQKFKHFSIIGNIGSIINPYDFIYKSKSKCEVEPRNQTNVLEMNNELIEQLIEGNLNFKKKWYKSIFIYCLKLNNNLKTIKNNFSDKQMRKFIQSSEVIILKEGQQCKATHGAYIFQGKIESKGIFYSQGQIIEGRYFRATTQSIVMKFKSNLLVDEIFDKKVLSKQENLRTDQSELI